MRKLALACLLLSLALPAQETAAARDSTLLITTPGILTDAPRTQLKGRPAHWPLRAEDGFELGDSHFRVRIGGSSLAIAMLAGSAPHKTVRSGKSYALRYRVGGGQQRTMNVGFVREHDKTWSWYCADVRVVTLGKQKIRLVDANADGRFSMLKDGYLVPGARTVCPLAESMVIGASEVHILTLADNGEHLRVAELALPGSRSQLEGLQTINRLRASNGLPGVTLAEDLSVGCTAHAQYLVVNNWDGATSPHTEEARSTGFSKQGAEAAMRSLIMKESHVAAVPSYWRTWFHRRHIMDPVLARVGINAEPEEISVIDVLAKDLERIAWSWPVCVPADGAIDIPVAALREMPSEPVKELGSRGFPIMALYRRSPGDDIEFEGTLVSMIKGRARKVRTLVGDRGKFPRLYGIVPEKPLRPATDYVATLEWRAGAEVTRRVIRFRTR
ncbi:MAG: hypothetical protein ACI89X_000902 [Planctomycetota bacterium]|jgi:hypothetical protein